MSDNNINYFPAAVFYFSVHIGGNEYAFQEVSGLEVERELEEIVEGGVNNYVHKVPKRTKYNNIVLKRGSVKAKSSLIKWCERTIQSDLTNKIQTKDIIIKLLDPESDSKVIGWNVIKAYPVKWSMGNLNAQDNSIAIETIELAFRSFSFL